MRTTKFKRLLSAILAVCLVFGSAAAIPKNEFTDNASVTASAQGEQEQGEQQGDEHNDDNPIKLENGYYYHIEDDAVVIEYYEGSEENLVIPSTLGGKPVTRIEFGAFAGNDAIKTAVLPNGLESVANDLFADCVNLESVTIPDSVKIIEAHAFDSCEKLKSFDFKNVEHISEGAFRNTGFETLTVPDTVTEMEYGVFSDCQSLTSAALGKGMTRVPEAIFAGNYNLKSVTIPAGYTAIDRYAFDSTGITEITLPEGLKIIDEGAFSYLEMTSIHLPASVDTLGSWAFNGSMITAEGINLENIKHMGREVFLNTPWLEQMKEGKELVIVNDILVDCSKYMGKELTVPDGIREIAGQGISHAQNLEKVIIPEGVQIIGENAFDSDENLKEVVIPKSVESIGTGITFLCPKFEKYTVDKDNKNYTVDSDILYSKDMKQLISCPPTKKTFTDKGNFVCPDTVEVIGNAAFNGCEALEKVELPNSIRELGNQAFCDCNIQSVNFPEGLERIGWECFQGNDIKAVEIPASVREIEDGAFCGNANLSEVTLYEGLDRVGERAFMDCPALTSVLIPHSVFDIGWNAFGVKVVNNGEQDEQYEEEEIVNSDFTLYSYYDWCPAQLYAQDTGVKYVKIADNVRMAGSNRFNTAVAISEAGFEQSDYVVIASGLNFPDALAGVPAASMANAPILLASKDTVSKETLEEIRRLGAKNAIILGGTGVISEKVEAALKENGISSITRLAGTNRFSTAAEVALAMYNETEQAPENLFFVVYDNYADSVSVSCAAGATNSPILFVKTKGDIDDATKKYLDKVKDGVKNVYIIGGTGVISEDMQQTIDKYVGKKSTRLAGKDRFDTNLEVIKAFSGRDDAPLNNNAVGLATGLDYPDALTGGVLGAIGAVPLLLVNSAKGLTDAQKEIIKAQKAPHHYDFTIATFGGTGAVSEKLSREACMQIQYDGQHHGGIRLEDSAMYKFMQTMAEQDCSFNTDLTVGGHVIYSTEYKSSGDNVYIKSTYNLSDETFVSEDYVVDGKKYELHPDEKTYYVSDTSADEPSKPQIIDGEYDVISSEEIDGEIVEVIRTYSIDEHGREICSDSTAYFDKQTGALKRIQGEQNGQQTVITVTKFEPNTQPIQLPDLTDWTLADDDE